MIKYNKCEYVINEGAADERLMVKSRFKIIYCVLFIGYFTAVYFLFKRLGVTCVFKEIFGIPCPGCGMTRAMLSLIKLDIIGAVKYNAAVFFMPYVFAYIFFDFKSKIHNYILLGIAVIAIANWILKLIIY